MTRRFTALWLLSGFSVLAAGADPLYESAQGKLDSLLNGAVKPGSAILFTPREIEAWANTKAKEQLGEGVRDVHVTLAAGAGSGAALVDFLKIRQARGKETNALMARMLEGERLIKAEVRVTSRSGQCTVNLDRVEMQGSVVNPALLDFIFKTSVLPLYPDLKLGEPFDLPLNMERVELVPEGVRVVMKK